MLNQLCFRVLSLTGKESIPNCSLKTCWNFDDFTYGFVHFYQRDTMGILNLFPGPWKFHFQHEYLLEMIIVLFIRVYCNILNKLNAMMARFLKCFLLKLLSNSYQIQVIVLVVHTTRKTKKVIDITWSVFIFKRLRSQKKVKLNLAIHFL